MTKKDIIIFIISTLMILLIPTASYFLYLEYAGKNSIPIVEPSAKICTQEAKLCPDGSYVSRQGPNCEFAQCPRIPFIENWEIFRNEEKGFQFQYPKNLETKYIEIINWPPQIQVIQEPFSCDQTNNESESNEKKVKITLNQKEICQIIKTEEKDGNIYNIYTYSFIHGDNNVTIAFSLHYLKCEKLSTDKKEECQSEQDLFKINETVEKIISTLQLLS